MAECNKEELDEAYRNNVLSAKQKYEDYEAYKNALIAQLLLEGISINDPMIQNLFYSNDPLNLYAPPFSGVESDLNFGGLITDAYFGGMGSYLNYKYDGVYIRTVAAIRKTSKANFYSDTTTYFSSIKYEGTTGMKPSSIPKVGKVLIITGLVLGISDGVSKIYDAPDREVEGIKQGFVIGTGLAVGEGVSKAVPSNPAVKTIAGVLFGSLASYIANELFDEIVDLVSYLKSQGKSEAEVQREVANYLEGKVEDYFSATGQEKENLWDGIENTLENLPDDAKGIADDYCDLPPLSPLPPDWLQDAKGPLRDALQIASPLVLDLDGDGVETSVLGWGNGSSRTYFDLDNDGFAERTGWVTGGDGLLALDKNNNGKIDNQSELFGNSDVYGDGFAALKALDSNNDNKITSADSQWSKLRVWVDADSDGVTDAGELKTLSSLKITQINLNATAEDTNNNGNPVTASSTFVMNGKTRTVSDVWFRHDQTDSQYMGDVTLNPKVLLLPTLKGFGNLKDLHVAMSEDATLLTMMENLVANWNVARLMSENETFKADVKAILFRWAEADALPPGYYGTGIYAPRAEFINKIYGEWYPFTPLREALVAQSFEVLLGSMTKHLTAQVVGREMPEAPYYDLVAGDLAGGVLSLGTGGNNSLGGDTQNDLLIGGAGNDTLYGYAGNDTLIGGTGKDTMDGGAGDDTYVFSIGDSLKSSPDIIRDYVGEGSDTIKLTGGILPEDVLIWADSWSMNIQYTPNDLIVVEEWQHINSTTSQSARSFIDKIVFDNGNILDIFPGFTQNDTDDGHTIVGSAYGEIINANGGDDIVSAQEGNDTINAGSGNDVLSGGDGDDILNGSTGDDRLYGDAGNDILNGGAGYDIFYGGAGDDIYVFRAGDSSFASPESIYELVDGGTDTIKLEGILPEDVLIWSAGMLKIRYTSSDEIEMTGIEKVVFDNGIIWDLTKNGSFIRHTNADGVFWGTEYADDIAGNGGNDKIYGQGGDDILNGGTGNDTIEGGAGNDIVTGGEGDDKFYDSSGDDTYVMTLNNGFDYIEDYTGNDKILFPTGLNQANTTYAREGNDLVISVSGTQVVRIWEHFNGWTVETLQFSSGATVDLTKVNLSVGGTSGNDTLNGTSGNDVLNGFAGNDDIKGGAGNDILIGGIGSDSLYGGLGDDIFSFSVGDSLNSAPDVIDYYQGEGVDTIRLTGGITLQDVTVWQDPFYQGLYCLQYSPSDVIQIQGWEWITVGYSSSSKDVQIDKVSFDDGTTVSFERLLQTNAAYKPTKYNDTFDATYASSGVTINLLGGNDRFTGSAYNDNITGGAGTDTLNGGAGNDTYNIAANSGLDTITDSSGADKIVFGSGIAQANTAYARTGNDLVISVSGKQVAKIVGHFTGTGAVETLQFSNGTTVDLTALTFPINGTAGNDTLNGTGAADTINGLAGNDTLNGGAGNDTIYGGAGNDTLNGGAGNDTLRGEGGNDIYVYDGGQDKIYETGGTDVLKLANAMTVDSLVFSNVGTADTKMAFSAGNDVTLYGQRGTNAALKVETVQFADGFSANLANYKSWTWGGAAAQTTNGTANADTILGRGGNDTINGNGGNDSLHGGSGNDTVKGGGGNDLVHGGIGADKLYGDAGNDTLYGDDGLDNLWGGTGADTFMFLKETAFKNIDVINDFSKSQNDKINIKDLLQGYDPVTKSITDFVQITTSGSDSILKVDADGGANGFVQIATIKGVTGLTDEQSLVNSGHLVI